MRMVSLVVLSLGVATGTVLAAFGQSYDSRRLDGLTDFRCNFAYRETPPEETLNANPLWEPLPPESALGPRPHAGGEGRAVGSR